MPFADGSRKGETGTGELLLTLLTRRENRLDCRPPQTRSDGRKGGGNRRISPLLSLSSDMGPFEWVRVERAALSLLHVAKNTSSFLLRARCRRRIAPLGIVRSPAESECGVADDNVPRKPFLLRRACVREEGEDDSLRG